MSTWQEGDILTNGMRMHYYRTGTGQMPPLVLCHGFSDNGLCWTPVARALEDTYDIIMIDARGHGKSECPESDHGSDAMADDLAGLIRGLGLERPVVMGHSMGGSTTLNMVAKYPQLASRAILEDAGPRDLPASSSTAEVLAARVKAAEEFKTKTREQLIADGRVQSPLWSDDEWGPWADAKLQMNINMITRRSGPRTPWRTLMPKVQCPLLIIRSDNDKGAGVRQEDVAEAQRINPLVQDAYVPGAGHNIRREAFEGYMQVVKAFLADD